jgi:radical SAM-linked protein
VTSDHELVDIVLEECVDPRSYLSALGPALPVGLEPVEVREVGVDAPSLQSQLRRAAYEAVLQPPCLTVDELNELAEALLAAGSFPAEYVRTNKVKAYDLRPLILSIEASAEGEATVVRMHLRAEQENTARADQVLIALGVEGGARIHRTRLELDDVPSAVAAFRRAGEPIGEDLA